MASRAIIGLDTGDEGKGHFVDVLARDTYAAIRYSGGGNAGHTVVDENGKVFIHHLIPAAALQGKNVGLARGVVADVLQLSREARELALRGYNVMDKLLIDEQMMLVLPHHRIIDLAQEYYRVHTLKQEPIGTTARGIGPAYVDEANRCAAYFTFFFDRNKDGSANKDRFARHVREKCEEASWMAMAVYKVNPHMLDSFFNEISEKDKRGAQELLKLGGCTDAELDFTRFVKDGGAFDVETIVDVYWDAARPFVDRMVDLPLLLNKWISEGRELLFEGAQGRILGKRDGYAPNVSSSDTTANEVSNGVGVRVPLEHVLGVTKAYHTKVGTHIFPTKMKEDSELAAKLKTHEFGATTGRQRMVGWYDLPQARRSQLVNGCDEIAMPKLDLLSGQKELRVAVAYTNPETGARYEIAPRDAAMLRRVQVEYDSLPGWDADISGCRNFEELPGEAQHYVAYIVSEIGKVTPHIPLSLRFVSVGKRRDQVIPCEMSSEQLARL